MTLEEFWTAVEKRFDPVKPAQRQEWRVPRPYSPRDAIRRSLRRTSEAPPRHVVIGTPGTGLSTEVLAIAAEHCDKRLVVFFDVYRYFNETLRDHDALQHVEPWEVLFLLGLVMYRAVRESPLGYEWSRDHLAPFERVIAELSADDKGDAPTINMGALASTLAIGVGGPIGGLAGLGLNAVEAVGKAVKWNIQIGKRDRTGVPDQDARIGSLRDAVNLLIGTVQYRYQPLLLVVDGLDRIWNETTTRRLFVESNLLSSLECATVVSGPLLLRRTGLVTQLRGFVPRVLANVPVLDPDKPTRKGDPGLATMRQVYRTRITDLGITDLAGDKFGIPELLLDELAYYSGGRMRDFIRFVRMTADECLYRELALADRDAIDVCIEERRHVMEMGLVREDINLMMKVVDDPDHLLPEREQISHLLDMGALLPYPNKSVWYFPHPLLMINRIRLTQPG